MKKTKENLKLLKEWIEALESGKYRKTTGNICKLINKRYSYCCLGVLCEAAGLEKSFQNLPGMLQYNIHIGHLPASLMTKFDVDEQWKIDISKKFAKKLEKYPKIYKKINTSVKNEYQNLIAFNDCFDLSFKEIATVLREYYNIKN